MRFRTKTIVGVAAIEMVLLAILVGSALSILRDSNEVELTRRVQLGGKLLAAAAKDAVISQDLATLDSLLKETMASGQIDFIRVIDADGKVLSELGPAALLQRPAPQPRSISEVTDGVFEWVTPISVGTSRHGEVHIGVYTAPLDALLASARRWAAGIAGLEMILVALFSWLLGSYLVRELVALRSASARLAGGDFDFRMPVRSNDELGETAGAFNSMAKQLGESRALLEAESAKRLDALRNVEAAQAQAEQHAEQLRAIFDLSPDGFVSFDEKRRVKYMSPAFARLTGIESEAAIGMGEDAFSERLASACIAESRFAGINPLRRPRRTERGNGGTPQDRRQTIEIAGPGHRVLEVGLRESLSEHVSQILYLRDITHETEVDRLKSEFLSTAAHELRTPMASIYGFAELMLAQEFPPEEQREFLATIFKQSELMISIINELLDLARIEARRGKDFNITRIDLRELLRDIVTGFKPPGQRMSPREPEAATALWVRADRKKLMQAIANVLSNAYKYSPEGGEVDVSFVTQDESPEVSAKVGVRITDHGIGMTPEQLSRVFERFYRADTSGKIPGTGLGMPIVKEIIELHGGSIELESTLGGGTTVTLWLQTNPDGADPAPAREENP